MPDFTYTPAVNQIVTAECCGGSGQGHGDNGGATPGGGGGGGAYARRASIHLTAGIHYLVRVGAPFNVAAPHESLFVSNLVVQADFGTGAPFAGFGSGGLASSSTGDFTSNGGNGVWVGGPFPGGGGGARGGRGGAGSPGTVPIGGSNSEGDLGGDGGALNQVGFPGPGGGGGGGGADGGTRAGGVGTEGYVIVWADADYPFGAVAPRPGATPIITYGTLPPGYLTPISPKTRRSAFIS